MTNWQDWVLATPEDRFTVIPSGLGLDLATVMNVLGVTGITAYFGMVDVGRVSDRRRRGRVRRRGSDRIGRRPDRAFAGRQHGRRHSRGSQEVRRGRRTLRL